MMDTVKKRHKSFHWTEEAEKSFELLKENITKQPILVLPDFSKTFQTMLNMLHGTTKKTCGRNTCKFFTILKKTKYKNEKLHFEQLELQNHISKSYPTYTRGPNKIMVQPNGLRTVKGVHSLGQWVERNRRFWLELLLELSNCIILLLKVLWCKFVYICIST